MSARVALCLLCLQSKTTEGNVFRANGVPRVADNKHHAHICHIANCTRHALCADGEPRHSPQVAGPNVPTVPCHTRVRPFFRGAYTDRRGFCAPTMGQTASCGRVCCAGCIVGGMPPTLGLASTCPTHRAFPKPLVVAHRVYLDGKRGGCSRRTAPTLPARPQCRP